MYRRIILDCHYICYSAYYTTGFMSDDNGQECGILYGFLYALLQLAKKFKNSKFIFCWDSDIRKSKRRQIYKLYKMKDITAERNLIYKQINYIRDEVISAIGFKNSYIIEGYESDDLIGDIAIHSGLKPLLVVSSDADLWQLLGYVDIYDMVKKKVLTEKWFTNKYKINPSTWADVKALVGCNGDNVPGINGIGEITAMKYLHNKLNLKSIAYSKIINNKEVIERNDKLVRLPFERLNIKLHRPERMLDRQGFVDVCIRHAFNFNYPDFFKHLKM